LIRYVKIMADTLGDRLKGWADKLKGWAAIITAVGALVVSVEKAVQKPEEPAAKVSYSELSKAVEQTSKATVQNHDDLVALRAYLKGKLEDLRDRDGDGIRDELEEGEELQREGPKAPLKKPSKPQTVGGGLHLVDAGAPWAPPTPAPAPAMAEPLPPIGNRPVPYNAPPADAVFK
jgi:hypothetical protein